MHHDLKLLPQHFNSKLEGRKSWEYRLNDRNFQPNDTVSFREWYVHYTGREMGPFLITLVLGHRDIDIKPGMVIFSHDDGPEEIRKALEDMIDLAETAIECDQEDDIKQNDRDRIAKAKAALSPPKARHD